MADFDAIVAEVQTRLDPASVSPKESLALYGLHKQAEFGDAEDKQP
ncbi:MAG: acyl-CoA-binding protein [Terracidiphilus sp.]|nr:acyl-CoA-binding protein [Terracidiphilus sp.]